MFVCWESVHIDEGGGGVACVGQCESMGKMREDSRSLERRVSDGR